MANLAVRPVSERQARTMLMGMTMVPMLTLFLAPFFVSFVFAWRSWWSKPFWFWRPLTLVSLIIALGAAVLWPVLYGQTAYETLFDFGPVDPTVTTEEKFLNALSFVTISYIAWSIAMLPHMFARIVLSLVERNRAKHAGKIRDGHSTVS